MPLQICAPVSAPAVTTSLTLLLVMTCRREQQRLILWLGAFGSAKSDEGQPAELGSWPLISAIASFDGRVGLLLDVLEDRHALVAR